MCRFGVNVKHWLIFFNKKRFKNKETCRITSSAKTVRSSAVLIRLYGQNCTLGFIQIGMLLESIDNITFSLSYSRGSGSTEPQGFGNAVGRVRSKQNKFTQIHKKV